MPKQRQGPGVVDGQPHTGSTPRDSARSGVSRRGFLSGVAGAAVTVATAGCSSLVGAGTTTPVSVLAAGSLQQTLRERLTRAVDVPVQVEAHGSVTVTTLIESGKRDPDVVALADTDLFDTRLDTWFAAFATNALVVAVADTAGGRAVSTAERWFDPFLEGEASLGRTDPDLDPLGYRTVFACELAERYYDRPALRDRLLAPDQLYPETSLLSRLETGAVDAAVVYRSMAVQRDYEARSLPARLDLSDPSLDDHYGQVSYALPDGTTVAGEHVSYGATARTDRPAVRDVFEALTDGVALSEAGFIVPGSYPRFRGAVPEAYRE